MPTRSLHALGTDIEIILVGAPDELLEEVETCIHKSENRWSRFIPTSELNELNSRAESFVVLSPDTYQLVERAVKAWRDTQGLFDPTVLRALVAAGYDRSFETIDYQGAQASSPSPGCAAIEFDAANSAVKLPENVSLDLGGIGKGFLADTLAKELRGRCDGACINIGGDLRAFGKTPDGTSQWKVGLANAFDEDVDFATILLEDGAVATTSTLKRRWADQHHVIDPRTGKPSETGIAALTVYASNATAAEVAAKAGLLAGIEGIDDVLAPFDAAAMVFESSGVVTCRRYMNSVLV